MISLADLTRGPERAFPTHARLERYYPAAGAEEARSVLVRTIERGEGPALLIGSPGTGKSMLLQVVAHDVAESRAVACLTSAQLCTRRALLQSILFELGQPFRQRDEGELRLELIDYLQSANVGDRGVVLLVDEAQSLPTRLLEELRVLSNLSHQGDPRLHLVLAGSQALDEKFTSPEVEAFNQRIAARCYLSPFNHHDTAQYVRGHLAAAGADPDDLFTGDALRAVYEATGGIARLINQLCDRALLVGARRQALRVNRELVQGAWADLQQLPTPWNLPDTSEDQEPANTGIGLFEYGSLRAEEDLAAPIDETELDDVFDPFEEVAESRSFQQIPNHDHQEFQPTRVFAPDEEDLELVDEEELDLAAPDARFDSRVDEFDENFQEYEPEESVTCDSSPRAADDEPKTSNPFDEMFDDEEIVIDPFASLQGVFSGGGVPVRNTYEKEISGLLHKVPQYDSTSPAEPSAKETEASTTPAPPTESETYEELSNRFTIVEAFEGRRPAGQVAEPTTSMDGEADGESSEEASVHSFRCGDEDEGQVMPQGAGLDSEIVVIDDDAPTGDNPSIAFPTDYRQLFASLRRD